MAVRQYIGARYVPKFMGDYDATISYEPLSIVRSGNDFYTSKIPVPSGIPVNDSHYWALTGNYNATIANLDERVEEVEKRYPRRNFYMPEQFGAVVNDESVDCAGAIAQAINAANANSGIVLLSSGIYYCDNAVNITERVRNVLIIGAGESDNDGTNGTMIMFTGSGACITFNAGCWRGRFENFSIKATNTNSKCIEFNDSLNPGARIYETEFENIDFQFTYIGAHLAGVAYVNFNNCDFRAVIDADIPANRKALIIGNGPASTLSNEYLFLRECRFVARAVSDDLNSYNSMGIYIDSLTHLVMLQCDITDSDYGLYLSASRDIAFIDSYSCNFARVHVAINIDIASHSVQSSHMYGTVVTGTGSQNDRLLKINRVSGGGAYAAYLILKDVWVRTGIPGKLVELDTNTLAPGAGLVNVLNYGMPPTAVTTNVPVRTADLGTLGSGNNDRIADADLNDYIISGFQPRLFMSSCTNSPGFNCYLFVLVSGAAITQIAIPSGSAGIIAFRTCSYSGETRTWSNWSNA